MWLPAGGPPAPREGEAEDWAGSEQPARGWGVDRQSWEGMRWAETRTETASGLAAECHKAHASLSGTHNRAKNPALCLVSRGGQDNQHVGEVMSVVVWRNRAE